MMEWISVKDRLPEPEVDVLLISHGWGDVIMYIGRLSPMPSDDGTGNFWGIKIDASEWRIRGWSYFRKPHVTHWMPLPKPPKEGE